MASEKPKLKSILKKPRPESQAPRSGRAISRCASESEHFRKTEQLLGTLSEARCLNEKTEKVLQDLKSFRRRSPGRRAVSVEAAQKMLSDVKELNDKYLHEQNVLIERLKVKSEAFSTIGEMIRSLIQDVESKRSELSEELLGTRVRYPDETKENRGAPPELDRSIERKTIEEVISSVCSRFKLSLDDYPGQLKAVDALIASLREKSEERQKRFLEKKETIRTQMLDLEEALRKIKLDAEVSSMRQVKRAQEAVQECFVKHHELSSAKAHLEALETQVRSIDSNIGDIGCPRQESCDTESIIGRIQNSLEALKNIEIPNEKRTQLRNEMNRFYIKLHRTLAPAAVPTMKDEGIQTFLSGARLSEAIKTHAATLLKRDRSRKSELAKLKSAAMSSRSR